MFGMLLSNLMSDQLADGVTLGLRELGRDLRDAEVTLLGGFHSPMEQECLQHSKRVLTIDAAENRPLVDLGAELARDAASVIRAISVQR